MDKVCRLCGKTSNKFMYNIFQKYENGQQIIHLIKQCLPILVYRTDPLSKNICEICYTKLHDYSSFQKNTVEVHDKFKLNLEERLNESPVKLYIDTLENSYQPETIQLTNLRSPRPVRNCGSQIQADTKAKACNTIDINPPSLKILTPSLINKKSTTECSAFVALATENGNACKRRKLAGPKSRRQVFNPATLLQSALKQINKNLNLIDDNSVSDYTSETFTETEYSISRSVSQERDDVYTPLSLLEPYFDEYNVDINVNQPSECNYCMQKFDSLTELSIHELKHIKVDIGPRCDTKEYSVKCKKYVGYYYNYVGRVTGSLPSYVRPAREIRVKSESELKPPKRNSPTLCRQRERSQHIVEEEQNSLLVPNTTSDPNNCVFKIENYIVYVNGVPLKSMTKEDRRVFYKDMIINDMKRKYCPLCRHTFKDNWAIEAHYLSEVCQYTCKFCGRKFKHQAALFEQHLKIHKGEPINKVFGPATRPHKLKKRMKKPGRVVVGQMMTLPPKVKPIKLRQLLEEKKPSFKVKHEPQEPMYEEPVPSVSNSNKARTEPYQAYFCRKCFKVFFNVNEYNKHIRVCTGNPRKNSKSSDVNSASSEVSTSSEAPRRPVRSSEVSTSSEAPRRPVRSCVKDISALTNNDSDVDSDDISPKKSKKVQENGGYECGICCSSFPNKFSRNSHMRIHKNQKPVLNKIESPKPVLNKIEPPKPVLHKIEPPKPVLQKIEPPKTVLNKVAPKSHTITKQTTPQISNNLAANLVTDIRLSNLNPAVARLVQNNPHLTIRSFSKAQVEAKQQEKMNLRPVDPQRVDPPPQQGVEGSPEFKRVYKCGDCDEKFENKSVLYYHKMDSCIIKRHYECAFCKKKFGTYEQYNTHMFYVHPE